MLRLLVADDHPIFRRGLKEVIEETSDMVIAGEASDGPETLSKVRMFNYDVVLLDITMPGQSGLDVLTQLKKEKPALPVLILSMHPEEQYAMRAIKAGASGYLTKESLSEELLSAIRLVAKGRNYVSSALAEKLASILQRNSMNLPHETLSNREFQVMQSIASWKTVAQIAAELSLSVKTISTYRTRILKKMGMKNNAELISYAVNNRLVD